MKLDVNVLGTFHRMAREGAEQAANRLTQMTGVGTRVEVTKLNFMTAEDVQTEFGGRQHVGVRVDLAGGPGGTSIIVFEAGDARQIVSTLLQKTTEDEPEGEESFGEMDRSAITELGHIMNNGFIDGWADVLRTAIDISTPSFAAGASAEPIVGDLDEMTGDQDLALMFRSQIAAVGTRFGFRHYLFPDHDAMADTLARHRDGSDGFEFEKLIGFDQMVEQGATEVANSVTQMTGFKTGIEIRQLNFVPVESIPQQISEEQLVGVAFSFDGMPSGYLIFLFDEPSAEEIIEALLSRPPQGNGDGFDEIERSAIEEFGNIMASGFLDGWANVLGTAIDHSTPNYVRDMGSAVIDPIAIEVGQDQEYAFVFDTSIDAAERAFDCGIYAIPEEGRLEEALAALEVQNVDQASEKPSFPLDEAGGPGPDE